MFNILGVCILYVYIFIWNIHSFKFLTGILSPLETKNQEHNNNKNIHTNIYIYIRVWTLYSRSLFYISYQPKEYNEYIQKANEMNKRVRQKKRKKDGEKEVKINEDKNMVLHGCFCFWMILMRAETRTTMMTVHLEYDGKGGKWFHFYHPMQNLFFFLLLPRAQMCYRKGKAASSKGTKAVACNLRKTMWK